MKVYTDQRKALAEGAVWEPTFTDTDREAMPSRLEAWRARRQAERRPLIHELQEWVLLTDAGLPPGTGELVQGELLVTWETLKRAEEAAQAGNLQEALALAFMAGQVSMAPPLAEYGAKAMRDLRIGKGKRGTARARHAAWLPPLLAAYDGATGKHRARMTEALRTKLPTLADGTPPPKRETLRKLVAEALEARSGNL